MIKKIHIENFKSIEKQTVQFDDFSMLIGENGSGKTNLIHAINFIKKVVSGPNVAEAYKSFAALPVQSIYIFVMIISAKTRVDILPWRSRTLI
jgi:AAA15 family ATPase/GTPase